MPILGQKKPEEPILILPGKDGTILKMTKEELKLAEEREKLKDTFLGLSYYDKKTKRLIEQIYKDGFVFAVKDYNTGKLDFKDEVEVNNLTYKPEIRQAEPFRRDKVILFPTDVVDYGSNEQLLKDCNTFISAYWFADSFDYLLNEYYALYSWTYDRFHECCYLNNEGQFGWGKSRWKNTVGGICYRSTNVAGLLYPASLFHVIDYARGTTVIDEADFSGADLTAGITKVLTMGHEDNNPIVRCDSETGKIVSYNPYGTKIYSNRKQIPDPALRSRCAKILAKYDVLKSKPTNLPDRFFDERQLLINKSMKWRFDHYLTTKIDETMQSRMPNYEGRLCQVMIPVLSSLKMFDAEHKLAAFMDQKNIEITEDRKEDYSYRIFITILQLKSEQRNQLLKRPFTVGWISQKFNEMYPNPNWALSNSTCGKIIKNSLELETKMNSAGQMQLVYTEEDIERLKTKFNINS
jgi:hypothetical protein